ncbi:stage II sporulation protein R [Gorillibacterium sp. CAU 1737]|uniref:stage II sporulation protein R n=1 Tax=Gorillibacterium sp. CAU 1737 TaxID=3140362 RepID=UPI003260EDA4
MNGRVAALLCFSLLMLLLQWQTQKAGALGQSGIPGESIRIRIIANSDTIADQAIKRVIRDRIEAQLNGWASSPTDLAGARAAIRSHLPELEELVGRLLETRGFSYGYSVELGQVEFPEKMFGSKLYGAGEYEALRITLGRGEGQNWWCVLFPPLCFADAVAKEEDGAELKQAVLTKKEADDKKAAAGEGKAGAAASDASKKGAEKDKAENGKLDKSASADQGEDQKAEEAPKAKFFLWEMLKSFFRWVKGLFS